MAHARKRLGDLAEDLVARRLEASGCRILARNARIRYAELGIAGELDLIVLDGRTLVFVEVKAAHAGSLRGPPRPVLAVGPKKQQRLRRLARAWLATNRPPRSDAIRFDVVGVTFHPGGVPEIEWIRNAF